jgi:cell division protein FtsW (lipid II flippase)
MHTVQSLTASSGTARRNPIVEVIFLLAIGAFFIWLAQPLGDELARYGLRNRYQLFVEIKNGRAIWLATNLSTLLIVFAACGWLAMRIGRSRLPRVSAALLIAGLWLAVWGGFFATDHIIGYSTAAGAITLSGLVWARIKRGTPMPASAAASAFAFPGWVLFSGIGLVWLVDYSARSYPSLRFLAANHAEHLFAAYGVLTLAAACGPALVGVLARVFALLDTATLPQKAAGARGLLRSFAPLVIALLYAVWTLAIVLAFGKSRSALTSELTRLPLYVVGGWLLYRWALQGAQGRAAIGAALGLLAAIAALVSTGDFGQVLLIGLGLAIAIGAAVSKLLGGSRVAVLTGALIAVALAATGLQLVEQFGHLVSARIGGRVLAKDTDFAGKLEYLSELRWFAFATPAGGHGLTEVPWCGTLATLNGVTACNGVPRQLHSDYVFAGLAGVWGAWVALAITAALAVWLVSLIRVQVTKRAGDPDDFRHWVFVCFAVVTLAQLLFTCMGSLGLVVLTGVTYPLLAVGSASLIASAALIGLVLNRQATNTAPT